jgi:HSP20 family protein
MSLIHYEPWNRFNSFQNEINKLFDYPYGSVRRGGVRRNGNLAATSDWAPAVDIKEEDNQFALYVDIPGVEAKNIDITAEKGVLTIKGERYSETKDERDGYKRIERSRGSFQRSFTLPDTADTDRISAKNKNGVLEIVIPKHAQVQPRKIAVEE